MRFRVRASSVCNVCGATPVWLLATLALGLLSGCQKQDEIRRYEVKKMPQVERPEKVRSPSDSPMRPAGHGMAVSERMLGAIASQGRTLWVFKVEGPKDVVADQMPKFLGLMKSLKFDDDATEPPQWTLPEGWTERKNEDPKSPRFTTLLVKTDDKDLPLSVLRLPVPTDQPIERMPLLIVNMWCDQLGLPEKTAADLEAEEQPKGAEVQHLDVSGTQITLVNFLAPARPASSPAPASVAANGLPQWNVPEGWQPAPGNQFSLAAFEVKEGDNSIKTTISRAGGDLLENLNRWRGQLGLKAWSPDEMKKTVKTLSIDGQDGTLVELVGTDPRTEKPSCILGLIVPHADDTWFFKLTGDVELAQREKAHFEAFVQSVKFDAAAPESPVRPEPVRPAPGPGPSPRPGPIAAAPKGLSQWKVPDGWLPAPGNQFSLAAFAVKEGPNSIQTTVSRAGGDLLGNLNRWRGQLGLPAWSADEMKKTAKSLSVDGHDGTLVELVGKDARSGKPSCILGLIVPHGDDTWFFKLIGDAELAQREKDNFEAFVQSVKFE
ncbi:MAG: hypothetical protein ACKV2Q_00005 [Planctomycetaceae bacterium]